MMIRVTAVNVPAIEKGASQHPYISLLLIGSVQCLKRYPEPKKQKADHQKILLCLLQVNTLPSLLKLKLKSKTPSHLAPPSQSPQALALVLASKQGYFERERLTAQELFTRIYGDSPPYNAPHPSHKPSDVLGRMNDDAIGMRMILSSLASGYKTSSIVPGLGPRTHGRQQLTDHQGTLLADFGVDPAVQSQPAPPAFTERNKPTQSWAEIVSSPAKRRAEPQGTRSTASTGAGAQARARARSPSLEMSGSDRPSSWAEVAAYNKSE
ncbi:hypothetical protein I302_100694 [Kwoniella bestiolae CBS 10118]|uniref:Uncharacterized protein n=1 Tax=Kwoniella bestiolae CBS 10118 TaxID=1296100 RepID=A0AAJ8M5S5_9TREE